MGHEVSTSTFSQNIPVFKSRPLDTSTPDASERTILGLQDATIVYLADAKATPRNDAISNSLVALNQIDVSPKDEPPPLFTTMKRPLPPPKSRRTVRQEAKTARMVINLCDGAIEAPPAWKKVKVGIGEDRLQLEKGATNGVLGVPRTAALQRQDGIERSEERWLWQELAMESEADSPARCDAVSGGTGSQNGKASAQPASILTEKKREKKRKKLFGTVRTNRISVPLPDNGTAPKQDLLVGEKADLAASHVAVPSLPAGEAASQSTNIELRPVNGQMQEKLQDQAENRFVDKGYSSFSPSFAADEKLVPEKESELMESINSFLGLSSPFMPSIREKASKKVTRAQVYAEQQQDLDVKRSRRMREVNLAMKQRQLDPASNLGGRLSIGFLEDVQSTTNQVDALLTQQKSPNGSGARNEHPNNVVEPVNVNGDSRLRTLHSENLNAANQQQRKRTAMALGEVAENDARNDGLNVAVKTGQRYWEWKRGADWLNPRSRAAAEKWREWGTANRNGAEFSRLPITSTATAPGGETRLLELRNRPVSSKASSGCMTAPTLCQDGGLLDELAVSNEQRKRKSVSAEPPEREWSRSSTKALLAVRKGYDSTDKSSSADSNKRAKHLVGKAETALLRMGLPRSLFDGWPARRKHFWAAREDEFKGRGRELRQVISKHSDKAGSKAGKSQQRSNGNVAAADAILRDLGLDESLLKRLSNKKKSQWARLETELAAKSKLYQSFCAKQEARGYETSLPGLSAKGQANDSNLQNNALVKQGNASEAEESEEEEGWQYAIRWQGVEGAKKVADIVPLTTAITEPDVIGEESHHNNQGVEEGTDVQARSGAPSPQVETQMTCQDHFPNRQKPDANLLRQMQRKRYEDWSDDDGAEFHEYVVKAEAWGMAGLPAYHILILGRYLDRDKAEGKVREFILSCKPHRVDRMLEIQSVWSDGNFSQKMVCDGETGCRAFVEPEIVSASHHSGTREKVTRRKMYAVRFDRTISKKGVNGGWEDDARATTVDELPVFTTKSLANWHAKKLYQGWYKEHLGGPQNRCWLRMHDEDLCKHVKELNDEGLLFCRDQSFEKGRTTTDKMRVWVIEIAPKGPRN